MGLFNRKNHSQKEQLTNEQRQELTDRVGEVIIREARDGALRRAMRIAKYETPNTDDLERYKSLSCLTTEQQEAVCDLLSGAIADTIFSVFETVENNPDRLELIILKDGKRYNMADVSWQMGSEIACFEDDGWIQKFSEIGRFVL